MANSILKLKVESDEYDAKLKKAAEGIRHLADVAHKGGGELTGLEKAELDYIKALGDMETKSKSAAGTTRELENAFKELTVVYNNLSDVEKNDEGGKALAASLETLKKRAQEAKAGLNEATQALQGNDKAAKDDKSGIEGLTSALGINVKSLVGWGAALAAAKMALGVVKDALMSSESNVDEWGRTVRSAEGVYQSFLQSLNNSDFSSFLNNLGQVTKAAREAYDALDELSTRMTIINPERAKLQARQQELRAIIRRSGANSEEGKKALEELKRIEPLLSKSFKTESQMNYDAFEKLVRERLAQGGINLNQKSFNQFMKTFSSDSAYQNLRRNARGSYELKATSEVGKFQTIDTRNTEQKLLDLFTDEWRQANSGYLTSAFSARGAAASNALSNARYFRAGAGGAGGGAGSGNTTNDIVFAEDSIMAQENRVKELTQLWRTAGAELRDGILTQLNEAKATLDQMVKGPNLDELFPDIAHGGGSSLSRGEAMMQSIRVDMGYENMAADQASLRNIMAMAMKEGLDTSEIDANGLLERISNGENIPTDFWNGLMDRLNEALHDFGREAYDLDEKGNLKQRQQQEIQKEKKEAGEMKSVSAEVNKITGSVQGIFSGIQQLGIELPEGLQHVLNGIQGVTTVLMGISSLVTIITAIQGTKSVPLIGWALAGGGIIKAAGGTIVGNSYSGDNMRGIGPGGQVYGLNAGEVVLNRSQVSNLASALEGGGMGNLNLVATIHGENLKLALNNNGMRRGKGEIVTSKRF